MSLRHSRRYSAKRRSMPERDGSQVELTKIDDVEPNSRAASQASAKNWKGEDGRDNYGADLEDFEDDAVSMSQSGGPDGSDDEEEGKKHLVKEKRAGEEDNKDDGKDAVLKSFRELTIYAGYVIVLCVMSFGITSPTNYYFTKTMKDLFVDGPGLNDYSTMKDFWRYSETVLMDALYWDKYYNNVEVPQDQRGYVLFSNKMLGSPRFRQIRVSNQSCTIAKDFQAETKECFAPYSKSAELKEPFGLINGSAWNYHTERELNGKDIWALAATYDGGGYVQLLGLSRENATARMASLRENRWLDRATRAVFIEFTIYNPNVNLFCLVTIIWEYPATGGLLASAQFKTLKLLRYVTTMDYVVFGCEVLFTLYLLYYTLEEVLEFKKLGRRYFYADFWNYYDMLLIIFGYITLFFIAYVYFEVQDILKELLEQGVEQFANFTELGKQQQLFNQFSAIFVFLAWIKIFKFMTFNKTMMQLQTTLQRCAKDVAGFSVMFFIIFMAYAQWGYLIFGTQVYDFSSYQRSMYTLFRIILGDFDFDAIEQANRIMGPIFFITYVLLVFFVLLNMFLAIITDTYTTVKSELEGEEFRLGDYFMKGYKKIVSKLQLKKKNIDDIQDAIAIADTNDDNVVDFNEWKEELKARGHEDDEIEAVFAKYDLDGDRVLNMSELEAMNENLEKERQGLDDEIEGVEGMEGKMRNLDSRLSSIQDEMSDFSDDEDCPMARIEDFEDVKTRVDDMQDTVKEIASKCNVLLEKINHMDKAKAKRRQTLDHLIAQHSEMMQDDE